MPKFVDLGSAVRLEEEDDHDIYPIQPDVYRAPEVILGGGWRMTADIWNLGVMVPLPSLSPSSTQTNWDKRG